MKVETFLTMGKVRAMVRAIIHSSHYHLPLYLLVISYELLNQPCGAFFNNNCFL